MTAPTAASTRTLWLRLFLPLASGYLLSYLYRTSNAVIGPVLAKDLALSDQALGLLTSTYFLTFAAAQLPLGIALDRFGPRRVEASLLLIAAAGALAFALAGDLAGLAVGRALIGLGVAACLMAAFKAFNQWFPAEQQPALIGWVMTAGAIGALFAAQPLESAVELAGWRYVLIGIAVVTVAVATAIWLAVPDKPAAPGAGFAEQWAGVRQVLTHPQFWRYAPMGAMAIGGFMAIQGLWVSRWMAEIEGLTRGAIALRLTWMGIAMLAGCLFMGFVTTPLIRRGVSPTRLLAIDAVGTVAVFGGINLYAGPGAGALWVAFAFMFPMMNIAYSILAQSLPLEVSGRANTALNLASFLGAFGVQWGMGASVDALRVAGWSAAGAYRATFLAVLVLLAASVVWMLAAGRRDALQRA